MIGKDGVTEGVVQAVEQALWDHELIKVKLGKSSTDDRNEVHAPLAQKTGAHHVALVGKTLILYKAHPENPVIKLPKNKS